MNELYALESRLRQEIDYTAFWWLRGALWTDDMLPDLSRRIKVLRMMIDTELSCHFEWVDPPSFDELWEAA